MDVLQKQPQIESYLEAERIAAQVRAICAAAGVPDEVIATLPDFDWRV